MYDPPSPSAYLTRGLVSASAALRDESRYTWNIIAQGHGHGCALLTRFLTL